MYSLETFTCKLTYNLFFYTFAIHQLVYIFQMQRPKRQHQEVQRFGEKENVIKYFVLWLSKTNTYLPTMSENHSWLSNYPPSSKKSWKQVCCVVRHELFNHALYLRALHSASHVYICIEILICILFAIYVKSL